MVRVSNFVVGFLNCVSLLLGVITMAFALYFFVNGGTQCQRVLTKPLLITGGVLFVVSFLGLIGSCCRNNCVLFIYLTLMFLLILGLIAFTVFVLLVTNGAAGKLFSQKGFKEHKTADYSNWLRDHFVNGKNWDEMKSCLSDAKLCTSFGKGNDVHRMASDFYNKTLSPIQSGCCKPPAPCGFTYKNLTVWEVPVSGPATKDPDCLTWSNNQQVLCYDCNSCKAGILANIRNEWRHLAILNVCAILISIFIYSVGCCARRSNKRDNKYGRYRGFA